MLPNGDVFPPHLTNVSTSGNMGDAKIVPLKCCANGLPEFSHMLIDFFNNADLQLIHDAL